jgi:7,8-dihydropterin-6-yl-methyl-4-(beta-D-ribofuranosyl)aminobenzene 5'-phosphate synthase
MAATKEKARFGELDDLEVLVMCEDSVMYESPYLGQHGICLLVRGRREGMTRTVLMDVGQDSSALLENFKRLQVDPREIDTVVITHCHYDHTQGLTDILRAIGKKDLPVVAHPSVFRLNFITSPYLRHVGVMQGDQERRLREAGAELYLPYDPLALMPGLFTTGEVDRKTEFEEVGISTLQTIDENGRVKPDLMRDDISLIGCVRGKRPLVMSGCSHAGIVNICRQTLELTGAEGLEGIVGGLHLVEAPEKRIRQTCEALKGLSIGWIRAGHCTGFRAQAALYSTFGEGFAPLQTGMRLRLTAD